MCTDSVVHGTEIRGLLSASADECCTQIKNTVITAQSCALAESKPFSMEFIKRLLDVQEDFEADMKGGLGYRDAMRQYT
jgi:hypothetical protein